MRQELIATHVDLGDLYAVAKDAGKASAQYQKALEQAGKLSAAGVGAADVKRITDMVRQRIQSGPPARRAGGRRCRASHGIRKP